MLVRHKGIGMRFVWRDTDTTATAGMNKVPIGPSEAKVHKSDCFINPQWSWYSHGGLTGWPAILLDGGAYTLTYLQSRTR
jgi:gentisate 1,2-dioxygenase